MTIENDPRWRMMFTRKRPIPDTARAVIVEIWSIRALSSRCAFVRPIERVHQRECLLRQRHELAVHARETRHRPYVQVGAPRSAAALMISPSVSCLLVNHIFNGMRSPSAASCREEMSCRGQNRPGKPRIRAA
jgi:hypothetical protein